MLFNSIQKKKGEHSQNDTLQEDKDLVHNQKPTIEATNSDCENEDLNLSAYLKKQKQRLSRLEQSQGYDPDFIFNNIDKIY